MNVDDLWIGDRVLLLKSGKRGIYIGQHGSGKCRVDVGGRIILSAVSNLEVLPEVEQSTALVELEKIEAIRLHSKLSYKVPKQVDLHADAIEQGLSFEPPEMILRKQLAVCKSFIESAIGARHTTITIIHGKGKGELRKEVDYLLSTYQEVHFTTLINNGGATEAWLR